MLQEAYIHSVEHLVAACRHPAESAPGRAAASGFDGTMLFHLLSGGHTEVIRACRTQPDIQSTIARLDDESRLDFYTAQAPDGSRALTQMVRSSQWPTMREYALLLRQTGDRRMLRDILSRANLPALLDEIVALGHAPAIPAMGEFWSLLGLTRRELLPLLPIPHPDAQTIMQVALQAPGNAAARKGIAMLGQFGLLEARIFLPH
jgi:hypothetical protein